MECSCTYTTPTCLHCLHAGTVVHVCCVEWSVGSGFDPNKLIIGRLPGGTSDNLKMPVRIVGVPAGHLHYKF
jgi:hypothetical protein